LRGAIEALLKKRNIEYYPTKGKGSFLVNAASGLVLYGPPEPRDSKIIVAPTSAPLSRKGQHPIWHSTSELEILKNGNDSRKALKKGFHIRCKEEAEFDEAVSRSIEEKAREKAEDQEFLERAMKLSLLEKRRNMEEENEFCEAIEMSKQESIINAMNEDEQLQQAKKESIINAMDEDEQIQQAIKISQNATNDVMLDNCTLKCEGNREDDLLLKTLELSMIDF